MDVRQATEAFRRWVWVSPDAEVTTTADWTLVRNPNHFESRLEVVRLSATADPSTVVDEVLAAARLTGLPQVQVWLRSDTPDDYADVLLSRGGVLTETLALLARDLTGDLPSVSSGAEIAWVLD